MSIVTSSDVPAGFPSGHLAITPSILYFGTPVVLLSTENDDGSFNLAPMSSAWALGQVVVAGLGNEGQRRTISATATTWRSACPHLLSGRPWNDLRR